MDIEKKYIGKIDFNCCEHKLKRNTYFLGYTGLKCCKVAMCLDCDKVQFLGKRFLQPIYRILRKIEHNRIEILEMIEIERVSEQVSEKD